MSNTYDISTVLPAAGFVIVEPKTLPKEVSGIINPNKDKEVPQWGTIVKVGEPVPMSSVITIDASENKLSGHTMRMIEFMGKAGQTVIYKKWGGNEVTVGEKQYYFLKFEEIIGVVQ